MSATHVLAVLGTVLGVILVIPFFIFLVFSSVAESVALDRALILWNGGLVFGIVCTFAVFGDRGWPRVGLAASGAGMFLICLGLGFWAENPSLVFFGLPGLLYAIAGIIPQGDDVAVGGSGGVDP